MRSLHHSGGFDIFVVMRLPSVTFRTLLLVILLVTVSAARPVQRKASLLMDRIMPLGDSITELDWQGGYRGYLYKMLSDSGYVFDYVGTKTTNHDDDNLGFPFPAAYWDHEGYNSATISSESGSSWIWNENVDAKLAANPPDLVLLLLGTNDLNSSCCTVDEIAGHLDAFLDRIWAFDSTIAVVLGSPPPADPARYSRLDSRVAEYVDLLPALVAGKQALGRAIAFADHHAVMNSTSDLVGDGIHPSPQGYRKMARVWYDAIAALLILPTEADDGANPLPSAMELLQNYPNPFNPVTVIRYGLPMSGEVRMVVYNLLGEEVATLVDEVQQAGYREVIFDASRLSSGVYTCRLTTGTFMEVRRMLLVR